MTAAFLDMIPEAKPAMTTATKIAELQDVVGKLVAKQNRLVDAIMETRSRHGEMLAAIQAVLLQKNICTADEFDTIMQESIDMIEAAVQAQKDAA